MLDFNATCVFLFKAQLHKYVLLTSQKLSCFQQLTQKLCSYIQVLGDFQIVIMDLRRERKRSLKVCEQQEAEMKRFEATKKRYAGGGALVILSLIINT